MDVGIIDEDLSFASSIGPNPSGNLVEAVLGQSRMRWLPLHFETLQVIPRRSILQRIKTSCIRHRHFASLLVEASKRD